MLDAERDRTKSMQIMLRTGMLTAAPLPCSIPREISGRDMPLRFTLRQLEYFVAVGECGSIAQAADRSSITSFRPGRASSTRSSDD